MNFDYDYLVIGAGSGGVRSARIAASHGAKVAIIENSELGGTCVNIGCVPKKLLAYASDFGPAFEDAKGFGWSSDNISFNWQTLINNKDTEIKRLNAIYETILNNAGVTIINGTASFVDQNTISVDGTTYTADKILIATGASPKRPSYKGAEYAYVSDDMFYLNTFPKHVVIEGGGYIALEFAHIFHGLGAKVTIIYRGPMFVRSFDHDIGTFLAQEMEKQGIDLYFNTEIEKIEKSKDKKIVNCSDGKEIECDLVLSAIGRTPNIDKLNLNDTSIKTDNNGRIIVNDTYQTSADNIYAVGDVTNQYHLTPVAIKEGHVLADRLFGNQTNRVVNYDHIATALFSNPPIGTVGLSEEKAKDEGFEISIFKTEFKPMKHTLSGRDEKTLMKLIVDKKSDRVLGCHIVGMDAPEMIQGISVAMNAGATKADFDRTMPVHPTAAEELVTLYNAVES